MTSVDKPSVKIADPKENISKIENTKRGILFALIAPIVGVVVWVVLWRMGFIASIASFAIAYLAVLLYKKGSGVNDLSRTAAIIVVGIVTVGVLLAFFAGIISDSTSYYKKDAQMSEWALLANGQFWSIMGDNFRSAAFWSSYRSDMLMSLFFACLGMFSTLKELFMEPEKPVIESDTKK